MTILKGSHSMKTTDSVRSFVVRYYLSSFCQMLRRRPAAGREGKEERAPDAPTRDPNAPGFVKKTELPDGEVPPADVNGNFIIGPTHAKALELKPAGADNGPQGLVRELEFKSSDSKIYPGIAREPGTFGKSDPNDPANLIVTTSHPAPYTRKVTVFVPKQYVPGTEAPFIVGADGRTQTSSSRSTISSPRKKCP